MMSSPPEFITPPGSERSLSGEGKDTMTAETTSTEQTQKVLHQNIPQNITKICSDTLILISPMLFRHFKSLLWEICTDKSLAVKYAIRPSQENTLYRATIKKFIKENLEAASFNVSFKKTTTKNHEPYLTPQ